VRGVFIIYVMWLITLPRFTTAVLRLHEGNLMPYTNKAALRRNIQDRAESARRNEHIDTKRVCRSCPTILSIYNHDDECARCSRLVKARPL